MMSKGSKLRKGLVQVSTAQYREMFGHFKDQMGTISFGLADLSMDLQALMKSLHRWEAAFDAFQDVPAKPSKKRPRTAKPHTSTRRKA